MSVLLSPDDLWAAIERLSSSPLVGWSNTFRGRLTGDGDIDVVSGPRNILPLTDVLADLNPPTERVWIVFIDRVPSLGGPSVELALDAVEQAARRLRDTLGGRRDRVQVAHVIAWQGDLGGASITSDNVASIVISPYDRHAPGSDPTPVKPERYPMHVAAVIASLLGWWRGATSAPIDDLRESRGVLIVRNLARCVVGPSPIGLVTQSLVSASVGEDHAVTLPVPNGFVAADGRRARSLVGSVEQRVRTGAEIHVKGPLVTVRAPKKVFVLEALDQLVDDLLLRLVDWPRRVTDEAVASVRKWMERVLNEWLVEPDSDIVITLEQDPEHPIVVSPTEAPSESDLLRIIKVITEHPTIPDLDPVGSLVMTGVLAAVDGSGAAAAASAWEDPAVVADPTYLARDPLRWMRTDIPVVEAHPSAFERWMRDAVESVSGLIQDKAGLTVPVDEVAVVVDVPRSARATPDRWTAGLCRYGVTVDGVPVRSHVLIHPSVADRPVDALETLAHELLHAALPGEGHGQAFAEAATAIGLVTSEAAHTSAGPQFVEWAQEFIGQYGSAPSESSPLLERLHLRAATAADEAWTLMTAKVEQLRSMVEEEAARVSEQREETEFRSITKTTLRALGRGLKSLLRPWRLVRFVSKAALLAAFLLAVVAFFPIAIVIVIPWLLGQLLRRLVRMGRQVVMSRHRRVAEDPFLRGRRELEHLASEALRLRRTAILFDEVSRPLGLLLHHPFGIGEVRAESADVDQLVLNAPRHLKVRPVDLSDGELDRLRRIVVGDLFKPGWLGSSVSDIGEEFSKWLRRESPSSVVPRFPRGDSTLAFLARQEIQEVVRGDLQQKIVQVVANHLPIAFQFADAEEDQSGVPDFLHEIFRPGDARPDAELWDPLHSNKARELDASQHLFEVESGFTTTGRVRRHSLVFDRLDPTAAYVDITARLDLWGPVPETHLKLFSEAMEDPENPRHPDTP